MRIHISEKVLTDLEFTTVLQQVAEFSISDLGRQRILEIQPIENKEDLLKELFGDSNEIDPCNPTKVIH